MTPICVRAADRLQPGDVVTFPGFDQPEEIVRTRPALGYRLDEFIFVRTRINAHVIHRDQLVAVVATYVPAIGYIHPVFGDAT